MNKPLETLSENNRRFYQKLTPLVEKAATRSYTGVVFSFLAVALFAWYAIMPTARTILFLRREIADKTVISQKMEEKIEALIEAQNTLDLIAPQLPLVSESLPSDPQVFELASQIQNLAQEVNASLSAVQVANVPLTNISEKNKPQTSAKTLSNAYTLGVVANGPFTIIKNLLTGLISLRRIIVIDSINLIKADTGSGDIRVVLKLTSYYFPETN